MIWWSRSGPRRSAEANAGPIAEREPQFPRQGDGRVVGDTSEQISGNSARATAAKVAGAEINDKARAEGTSTDLSEPGAAAAINAKYSKECRQLSILYADSGITTVTATNSNGATSTPGNSPDYS